MSVPSLPPTWWVLAGAIVFAAGRWLQLTQRRRVSQSQRDEAQRHGEGLLATLEEIAGREGVTPDHLPADLSAASGWVYRRVPTLTVDRRLIVLHEDAPRQILTRFPGEEEARTIVFADGRVDVFTESAFGQLIVGDDVLRERLKLPPIEPDLIPANPADG
ncbi:MAG: hypothetical protein HOM68_11670 [Gemmatimonadetes bacterium]|nr:hypothetical protein [Gemmatimonadota bacterium]MBT4612844.1 hypothetical protein [Gemmatimonadota bacterium]MBT5057189.1 hypothetical protein [Gemmatimonadota bacterium]MBT5143184.1 hypothetical protein [Gemmatimonadota bacterium]MBT5590746.1 hypothetical protein [Gemmatimonadota bacterium]